MATAEDRGWGRAYPGHCDEARARCLNVEAVGIRWIVRAEIADLVVAFVTAWHRTVEPLDPAQCWSFACRAIRGGTSASNHSWGLALDLNSAKHPLGAARTFSTTQMRALSALFARPEFRNFRWGGDFTRPDEMHAEYVGTPAQAAADTALLKPTEEDDMTPEQAKQLADVAAAVARLDTRSIEHGREIDVLKDRTKRIIDGDDTTPGLRQVMAAIQAGGGTVAMPDGEYEVTLRRKT